MTRGAVTGARAEVMLFPLGDPPAALAHDADAWCYVGSDESRLHALRQALATVREIPLGPALAQQAARLRQPFVDFLSAAGRNVAEWWTLDAASRSPFQSDLFLLICQKAAYLSAVGRAAEDLHRIVCFVDDPWLLDDLLRTRLPAATVRGRRAPGVVGRGLGHARRTAFRRARLAGFLAFSHVRTRRIRGSAAPRAAGPRAKAIVGVPEPHTVTDSGFRDVYTGQLLERLQAAGTDAFRVFHPKHERSLIDRIARDQDAWPLILELRWRDLWDVLTGSGARLPARGSVADLDVGGLLRRERWLERERGASGWNRVLGRLWLRFFHRHWGNALFFFYENQSWNKMLAAAASGAGGWTIIGHQHSAVSRYHLMHVLGAGEATTMPLPDVIITAGEYWTDVLRANGYPGERLVAGGSWKYGALAPRSSTEPSRREVTTVLLALPANVVMARNLVMRVAEAAGSITTPVEVVARPHPNVPLERLDLPAEAARRCRPSSGTMLDAIATADVVIYCATTAGLEALLAGKVVIRVTPELQLDLDSLAGVAHPRLLLSDGSDLDRRLEQALTVSAQPAGGAASMPPFFSRVAFDAWMSAASGAPRARAARDERA